jgi:hypothetical protein
VDDRVARIEAKLTDPAYVYRKHYVYSVQIVEDLKYLLEELKKLRNHLRALADDSSHS